MKYFTQEFLQFMQELPANNNREWFHNNKTRYEQFVKLPFETFVSDVINRLNEEGFHYSVNPKQCIFRIYRDIRFSKDKTPYKIHISALISPAGKKDKTNPGLYIQLSAEDVRFYSGCHTLNAKQLDRIRLKIIQEPGRFKKLAEDKDFVHTFSEIRGEKNKRIAKHYEESAKTQPLLYNKSFYYYAKFSPNLVLETNLIETIIDNYKNCSAMNTFLREALSKNQEKKK